jgi:hypothetical protein
MFHFLAGKYLKLLMTEDWSTMSIQFCWTTRDAEFLAD